MQSRPRPKLASSAAAVLIAVLGLLPVTSDSVAATGAQDDGDYPHGDFVDDCQWCHAGESKVPARVAPGFDHRKFSGFALRGAHATADCRACHVSLEFATARSECVACHQDAHRGELGVDCGRCHTPRSFIDRSAQIRAHRTTRFPLNGAHVTIDCESCHERTSPGIQVWVNTPADCEACHLDDYRATVDPDHEAAGFPTDCARCHSARGFRRAVVEHPYFPIYSGRHRNAWSSCSDCHTSPTNFSAFSCLECHPHSDRTETDGDHEGVSGYVYESNACYACHPRGSE